jgi:gliding motility-associated-like protein
LSVTSAYGCSSPPAQKELRLKPAPVVSAGAANGCVHVPVTFNAEQLDNATVITDWNWNFGNGEKSGLQFPAATYAKPGYYNVEVSARAANGCESAPFVFPLFINQAVADAGNDTVVLRNQPFQMHATGGIAYTWSPAAGLNNPGFSSPVAVVNDDASYTLRVTTEEGCTDEDIIHLKVFRGSDIQVPNAFTPNDDGRNDLFRPVFEGIKKLDYFMIYNRWGQLLYSGRDLTAGWNGRAGDARQAAGVYVWSLQAVDYAGKTYRMRGTVTLIR